MEKPIYKLRVPSQLPDGFPEVVSHGNREAVLDPGSTIETHDRRFADWLIAEYGLEEKGGQQPQTLPPAEEAASDTINDEAYPANFPARDILIGNNVAYETAIKLDVDQLKAYPGIGPKTAEQISSFVENGGNE
jgi:hypothetical protein